MIDLALLLIAAALAHGAARLLRVPAIPLLLLTGLGLAQYGPKLPDALMFNTLELGLVFLVFAAGIELNPRRTGNRGRSVLIVGVTQFTALGVLGYLFAVFLGYDSTTALYLAFALSASSTLVVIRCLKQRQQMFEPFGRLVTGVLLIQDVLIIVGIIIALRLPAGYPSILEGIGSAILLGALGYGGHRWLVPLLFIRLHLEPELRLLAILSLLFVFTALAWALGLPLIAGAFVAGYALSAFPVNGLARGTLSSLTDFFLAVFFVALGALILPPGWEILRDAALLAAFVVVVTVPLVAYIAERTGLSARSAIESGLLLSQTSEFSLVIALHGWMAGQITAEVFSLIAVLTVGTMTLTPTLSTDENTWRLMKLHPLHLRKHVAPGATMRDHIVLLGYGSAARSIIRALKGTNRTAVVVDDDAIVVRQLREQGIPCIRGDGSDPRALARVHARHARCIVASLRRPSDADKVLDYIANTNAKLMIRVFDEAQAGRLEQRGALTVLTTQPTLAVFLEWLRENGFLDSPEPANRN